MAAVAKVQNQYRFLAELRRTRDLTGLPIASTDVMDGLLDLIDEAFVNGVLAEQLPVDADELHLQIEPVFSEPPIVKEIVVHLTIEDGTSPREYVQAFASGRWDRWGTAQLSGLHKADRSSEQTPVYQMLLALPDSNTNLPLHHLEPPAIVDGDLASFGVRDVAGGDLVADRPVLLNKRLVQDSIDACLSAGVRETGKAVLGLHARLPDPLPGSTTRIVTLLTACVDDQRHVGEVNQWKISSEALEDAARVADLRGLRERVLTVVHTHGWSKECGRCNHNPRCPLAECTQVSLMDYQVLEQLFPSKATLLPIAGRKLGAPDGRPVLEVHAWRGGSVKPVHWMSYTD